MNSDCSLSPHDFHPLPYCNVPLRENVQSAITPKPRARDDYIIFEFESDAFREPASLPREFSRQWEETRAYCERS
jgi:hypothetical protein